MFCALFSVSAYASETDERHITVTYDKNTFDINLPYSSVHLSPWVVGLEFNLETMQCRFVYITSMFNATLVVGKDANGIVAAILSSTGEELLPCNVSYSNWFSAYVGDSYQHFLTLEWSDSESILYSTYMGTTASYFYTDNTANIYYEGVELAQVPVTYPNLNNGSNSSVPTIGYSDFQSVISAHAEQVSVSNIVSIIAFSVVSVCGLVFMWWGVRKVSGALIRAFKKGKIRV